MFRDATGHVVCAILPQFSLLIVVSQLILGKMLLQTMHDSVSQKNEISGSRLYMFLATDRKASQNTCLDSKLSSPFGVGGIHSIFCVGAGALLKRLSGRYVSRSVENVRCGDIDG